MRGAKVWSAALAVLTATVPSLAPAEPSPETAAQRWTSFASLRVAAGASLIGQSQDRIAAAFDVAAGARILQIASPSGWLLHPEIGYGYADNASSPHALTLGAGAGFRIGSVATSLVPRLVLGLSERVVGARTGLMIDLAGLATGEVSHQYLPVQGREAHSVRIMVGVDFGLAMQFLLGSR